MSSTADPAPSTEPDPFRHLAVVHHDVDELLHAMGPLLRAALARGDRIWVAVDEPIRSALEGHLDGAAGVVFDDPGRPPVYSGQTTAVRRADQLREAIEDGRAALVISDRATVGGPAPVAPDAWGVVDASCNLALRGLPATLVCVCDAAGVSGDTERFLYWNHPELVTAETTRHNPHYRPPDEVLASTPSPPAPPLPPPDDEVRFADSTALRGIRETAKRHGRQAGMDDDRLDGLVLAVCELVSNSIEHGAGHGTLSWWTAPGRVVAQVDDPGQLRTTPPGLRRPDALSVRGRGVWLARQLSDVLHLWTSPGGTHVRLELAA